MDELVDKLLEVIKANTDAMNRVSEAVESDAKASDAMAEQVRKLRGVITATQRKIGGELGPVIDQSKETLRKLNAEREEVRRARGEAAQRSGSDAGPQA
jgi:hypothetical protein